MNWNRTIANFRQMLMYSCKSARCKLTKAWLTKAAREHDPRAATTGPRSGSVLHFYGDPNDEVWNAQVRFYRLLAVRFRLESSWAILPVSVDTTPIYAAGLGGMHDSKKDSPTIGRV